MRVPAPDPAGPLDAWRRVADGSDDSEALLAAVAAGDPRDAATLARWRRSWSADLVAVAIELVAARRRGARKFPDAGQLVADVEGVEQATGHDVAAHKSRRFAPHAGRPVVDLCCGIGGDAMALAVAAGDPGAVTAVDRDPRRAWMAGRNAGCATRVADVGTIDLPRGALVHIDPARRREGPGGHRAWRYEDSVPGPAFIAALLDSCPDAAVKLGPGVDFAALPPGAGREVEIVSDRGALVQAVLWSGALAAHPGARTATRLPDGSSVSAVPRPLAAPPRRGFGRWLIEVDPAVERAQLTGAVVAELRVAEACAGLGLLTADEPVASPWLTTREIVAELPWRPARLAAWLAAHDGGIVTVRTRGGAIDTDAAQTRLRGGGDTPYTVFGLRLGRKVIAIVTRSA